jgi:chromosome segregation ATPase
VSNREIEKNEALARIKGLENELANGWQRDRIKALEDRIEQLEAALREIADERDDCVTDATKYMTALNTSDINAAAPRPDSEVTDLRQLAEALRANTVKLRFFRGATYDGGADIYLRQLTQFIDAVMPMLDSSNERETP